MISLKSLKTLNSDIVFNKLLEKTIQWYLMRFKGKQFWNNFETKAKTECFNKMVANSLNDNMFNINSDANQ